MSKTTEADSKMSASVLYERGVDFFQHGDYLAARRDFKQIIASNPNVELEKKAREMLKRTSLDPMEIAFGVGVLALLIFLYVYFGLRG